MLLVLLFFNSIFSYLSLAEVTNKQYASMPEVFHLDNYDRCMLLGDEALYCTIQYELEPVNDRNDTKLWQIIKEVSSDIHNYRHDHLRYSLCVPLTCPSIELPTQDEATLRQKITNCYDAKFEQLGLRGNITKLRCQTNNPGYLVDWIDTSVAMISLFYVSIVIAATFYEGLARYQSEEEYKRMTSTRPGKLLAAFSLAKNWDRLKAVKPDPETEKLRVFQGVRFYNIIIVIIAHTALTNIMLPQSNTKFLERITDMVENVFLSSGPLCVSTNFFMSSFFLFITVFTKFEDKKEVKPKVLLAVLIGRYLRLTPCLLAVVVFNSTWLRHFQYGPSAYLAQDEHLRCRKNWWTNIFYINTFVDNRNMCLPATWYLALDMQYYVFILVVVYYMKKHPHLIWSIIGCLLSVNIIGTFIQNYLNDFPPFMVPYPETVYDLNIILPNPQWHQQQTSVIGNLTGPIMGLAFGYLHYKYNNKNLVVSKYRIYQIMVVYTFSLICSLGIIIVPGIYIMMYKMEYNPFLISLYVAVSRPIFSIGIASLMFACVQGFGGLVTSFLEWRPCYILGRLAYTSYLIHPTVMMLLTSTIRAPLYSSGGTFIVCVMGNIFITFTAAMLLTLFVEMPIAELQKLAMSLPPGNEERKEK